MTNWDLRRLQTHLSQKEPHGVYVVYGDDVFLQDQVLASIRESCVVPGLEDFNSDVFLASEVSVAHVKDTMELLPVMASRRLIVVRGIDSFKDDNWEVLLPLLEKPVSTATLVLMGTKIDKRKKWVKSAIKGGQFVELKKPYDNQIPMWIDYICHLVGLKITADARASLQQLVGTNLSELHNEVKKIYSGLPKTKSVIEVDDVIRVVSKARIENVFSLTDAIARQDKPRALMCLANLLEHGQNEIGILALIYRQLRILSSVHDGVSHGLSTQKLSEKVGVPEFFMKEYMQQSRLWDQKRIGRAMTALHDTDRALKSSPVSGAIWLENFIVKTC
jgi:DNA polymerase-3 subunit delta